MSEPSWVKLREYASRVEADLDMGVLEGAGIPVVVDGPVTGIFGPGFAGATAHGVTVLVRREHLEEARETLGLEGPEAG